MAYDLAPSSPMRNHPSLGPALAGMAQPMAQPADPLDALPEALADILRTPNLAETLPDDTLGEIASRVVEEYDIDKESRREWEDRTKKALDLAMMVAETKNYPIDNASNIKFPLLTTAALQFNARAYPAIVQGNRVVKCQTWGFDQDGAKRARAERVSEHLSYQLLSELPEWEEDTDKLLVMLPIVGCVFRKVFWDDSLKQTATRLITADRFVVNYHARSLHDVPRTTEEMRLYPYEIMERIRSGRFIEFDYSATPNETPDRKEQDDQNDADAPQLFLEQHRLWDMDGDGYPEPYVVTVHHSSQKVCRIVANFSPESVKLGPKGQVSAIRKADYYVKYPFLPSPDGGFYGSGFGWYLKDISELINSTFNMLMDAGHLANTQGGFVSSAVGKKEKSIRLKPGEWRVMDSAVPLKEAFFPIVYPGPNKQLMDLVVFLLEAGKELAAIKDVLTGDTPATAPVGTTLAMIEQGLQVFTAIYKRVHRAIKQELQMHARINREHPDDERYRKFFDDGQAYDMAMDYAESDMDIVPVSDPTQVSRMQQVAKAQLIGELTEKQPVNPTINPHMAVKRILDAAQVENPEELIAPPPQPDPEAEALTRKMAMNAVKQSDADIIKTETEALKNIADAEAKEAGSDLDAYGQQLDQANANADREMAAEGQRMDAESQAADRAMNERGQAMDFANQGADRALQAEGMQMDNMNKAMDREQSAEQAELDRQGRLAEMESRSRNSVGSGAM